METTPVTTVPSLFICPQCWAMHAKDGQELAKDARGNNGLCTPHWEAYKLEQWAQWPRNITRRARRVEARKGKVLPFYVVSYGIDRRFGGREEGGWWYDVTEILEVRKVWSFRQARATFRELMEAYPTDPRGRGSVLGGQDTYVQVFADPTEFPEDTTREGRPPYC